MTRRDYCFDCGELVNDYDPMCIICNQSVCFDCLEKGQLKSLLLLFQSKSMSEIDSEIILKYNYEIENFICECCDDK